MIHTSYVGLGVLLSNQGPIPIGKSPENGSSWSGTGIRKLARCHRDFGLLFILSCPKIIIITWRLLLLLAALSGQRVELRKRQSIINRPVGGALWLAWYRGNAPTTGRFLALAQSLDTCCYRDLVKMQIQIRTGEETGVSLCLSVCLVSPFGALC